MNLQQIVESINEKKITIERITMQSTFFRCGKNIHRFMLQSNFNDVSQIALQMFRSRV